MKSISQEILNLINGDILSKRDEFNSIAESLNLSNSPVGDETLSSIIVSLKHDLGIIKESVNRGIIDSLPSNIRASLKNQITNLNNTANDLFIVKSTTDHNPFAGAVQSVMNFVNQYSLDFQLKHIPDYKKKLEEIKNLKEKLDKLNSDSEVAKKVLFESQQLLKNISDKYSQSAEAQSDLNKIVEDAKAFYGKLEESKTLIQTSITEIDTFYQNQYKTLTDAIFKSDTGLQATIDFASQKYNEAKDFADKAATSYNTLQASVTEYATALQTLTTTNASLQALFTKVNDPEQGVDKKFKAFSETKSKIEELYTKSTESFKIISDHEVKIAGILSDSTEKLRLITDAKSKAEATFSDIEKIYGIAADTAMGGEFNKKAQDSAKDFEDWGRKITNTTIWLFISIITLFALPFLCVGFCAEVKTPDFILRLTLTSPLIFYLVFCTNQYKKAKDNYYKYSFKATLAFSIKNHINLLAENPKFEKETYTKSILDFAIKGLEKIYEEPYFDKSMEHKFKIRESEIKFGKN